MRYPLARRAKRWVSVSSSGIALSQRYSEIGFHQSGSEPGDSVASATSDPVPSLGQLVQVGSPGRYLELVLVLGLLHPVESPV
jgi:hypothetical protein